MAITNHCQADFGTFQGVLSDPHTEASSNPSEISIIQTLATKSSQATAKSAYQVSNAKKKDNACSLRQRLPNQTNRTLFPTPPPQIEPILPGKQKVRVTPNEVQNTTSKRMRRLNDK